MTCRQLVEIGTWNGVRARELARAAFRRSRAVSYHGFDLFEDLTPELLKAELSKQPPSQQEVETGLGRFQRRIKLEGLALPWRRRSFDFALHRGFTRETLPAFRKADPEFRADFVWIDGGHKVETIANDWEHCSAFVAPEGVIYLDDVYGDEELAEEFGCNQLLARLEQDPEWQVAVLPATDTFPEIGSIQIARVSRARR
jgi:hypothetical protein